MLTLGLTCDNPSSHCGNYAAANAQSDEMIALAEEKGALLCEGESEWCSKVACWP